MPLVRPIDQFLQRALDNQSPKACAERRKAESDRVAQIHHDNDDEPEPRS